MFFSGTIMRKIGVDGSLHLCTAAFVLRLMMYTFVGSWPTPWIVLPVELLHGLTFGLAWAAGTHKAALLAPDGLMSSMQVRVAETSSQAWKFVGDADLDWADSQ